MSTITSTRRKSRFRRSPRGESGLTFLEVILVTGVLSVGAHAGVQHLKSIGAIPGYGPATGAAPSGAKGTAGASPLAKMQVLAMESKRAPLDITPDEMRELIATVKGLEGTGKFECPGPGGLKNDPIFSSSFGLAAGGTDGP